MFARTTFMDMIMQVIGSVIINSTDFRNILKINVNNTNKIDLETYII